MTWRLTGSGMLLGLVLGCGTGTVGGSGPAVRDSAGVEIVVNAGDAWLPERAWHVGETPVLDIGGDEADPRYDLGQVGGAVRFSDGRIGVADGATLEIRYYDADGNFLMSKGRKGSGPGEYQSVTAMFPPVADSLLLYDALTRRLTLLGPDGEVARSFYLGGEAGFQMPTEGRMTLALPTGRFGDGGLVGMALGIQFDRPQEGAFRDTVAFLTYDPAGVLQDTLTTLPGVEMEMMTLNFNGQSFPSPTAVPLGKVTVTTAAGEWFYSATNLTYAIEVRRHDGTLARSIRVAMAPTAITASDVEAHRKEQLEALGNLPQMALVPEPMKEQLRSRVSQAQYPETFPYLVDLQVDAEGYLWAQEVQRPGATSRRYAVFDSAGVLQGRVIMPKDFRPTFIGKDYLVGIWEDEDDLQHVRVYELVRS